MPEPGPGVWASEPHDCPPGQPQGEKREEQEGGLARGFTAGKWGKQDSSPTYGEAHHCPQWTNSHHLVTATASACVVT